MENISKVFALFMLVTMLSVLGGCGKVSEAEPYEDSGYPHSYPRR